MDMTILKTFLNIYINLVFWKNCLGKFLTKFISSLEYVGLDMFMAGC